MSQLIKSLATGIASGIVVLAVGIFALARTSAFSLPAGIPLAVWDTFVVFGLGVTLVAFIFHFTALLLVKPKPFLALVGFLMAFVSSLTVSGLLQTGLKALVAAAVGALLATGLTRLRSNNSFKPTPLRGAA